MQQLLLEKVSGFRAVETDRAGDNLAVCATMEIAAVEQSATGSEFKLTGQAVIEIEQGGETIFLKIDIQCAAADFHRHYAAGGVIEGLSATEAKADDGKAAVQTFAAIFAAE